MISCEHIINFPLEENSSCYSTHACSHRTLVLNDDVVVQVNALGLGCRVLQVISGLKDEALCISRLLEISESVSTRGKVHSAYGGTCCIEFRTNAKLRVVRELKLCML